MQNVPQPASQQVGVPDTRTLEKLVIVLLFFITVTQFSTWGYQSVIYLLSVLYSVESVHTPLDILIGLIAMIASSLVFAGAALWWKQNNRALPFITIGSLVFLGKNVLDVINTLWVFGLTHAVVTSSDITVLAKGIGEQFFQLAFWVFIFIYFKSKITHAMKTTGVQSSNSGITQ